MVQYDPFANLLIATNLPRREKSVDNTSGSSTPSLVNSPSSINSSANINLCTAPIFQQDPVSKKETSMAHAQQEDCQPAVHPQLRRLSSSHGRTNHYCASCHMRRPSQELLLKRKVDHSPDEESWDGFCPDIAMPRRESPRSPAHHTRRHSGLCPESLLSREQCEAVPLAHELRSGMRQPQHNSSGYHHECHCERITPIENLIERYGVVEEPARLVIERRRSMEKEANDEVAEIMHEELLSDMEAKQWTM